MSLIAALLTLSPQAAMSPPAPVTVRCIYDTVGADQMQRLDDRMDAGTMTAEQYGTAIAAARASCIRNGRWTRQAQLDSAIRYAMSMAQLVSAGRKLRTGGIDPDAVFGKWDTMPLPLRAALKAGVATYPGGNQKFVADIRAFLVTQTPAKQAPHLGHALDLLVAYGDLLRFEDVYFSASTASP